ncbi:MAG: hypothetical protein M2R45_01973 [Verrucomicrobia subdivision 3 bacterium]|nr:hypothetical protein [Limisphaerales bacterium]MCS1416160.1 hypothetical protein [Limisphaerales bacterium]
MLGPRWPKGYEAQVENTSPDLWRTESLYDFGKTGEQRVTDDIWRTQCVEAVGNRIIIDVNDKMVVDFVDEKETYRQGLWRSSSTILGVNYRNVMVRPLPDDPEAALTVGKKGLPLLK